MANSWEQGRQNLPWNGAKNGSKNGDEGVQGTEYCHLLAMWAESIFLTFLSFSFLIYHDINGVLRLDNMCKYHFINFKYDTNISGKFHMSNEIYKILGTSSE